MENKLVETRKVFQDADGFWMEMTAVEVMKYPEMDIRWFGPIPCSKVTLVKAPPGEE